jgi:hypothetical protein
MNIKRRVRLWWKQLRCRHLFRIEGWSVRKGYVRCALCDKEVLKP